MNANLELLNRYRVRSGHRLASDDSYGATGMFMVPGPSGRVLTIIATDGIDGRVDRHVWEHVSVSTPKKTPTWAEMCFVKDLFWSEEETVIQLHPPKSTYVSNHAYCLHLWRPVDQAIPLPPAVYVGYKSLGEIYSKGDRR